MLNCFQEETADYTFGPDLLYFCIVKEMYERRHDNVEFKELSQKKWKELLEMFSWLMEKFKGLLDILVINFFSLIFPG
jgi:endo-1,4-beta-mannosidase